jgi:hypothetical protein
MSSVEYLTGGRQALGMWLYQVPSSIIGTLQFFFLLLVFKILLRKEWLAAIAFVAIFAGLQSGSSYPVVEIPAYILVYAIAVFIVYRYGLTPLAVAIFTVNMLGNIPFTSDFSSWYLSTTVFALLSVVAIVSWGLYHSLGGQLVWKGEMG